MKVLFVLRARDRKETKEERKKRVQNDVANRSNVFANKKAYKRHNKHKGENDYE